MFGKRARVVTSVVALLILINIVLIYKGFFENRIGVDLSGMVAPLFVLLFTLVLAKVIKQILHGYFETASKKLRIFDKTRYALFGKLVSVVVWAIGLVIIVGMIPSLKAASVSIFASAGVLAIIIGFATQKTFGNLASGMFIAMFQPYRIGDRLKIMSEYGTIIDINLRHTTLETWDNRRILIPNSKMDDEVINNYTIGDPAILGTLDMGISYDSDIDLARAIIEDEIVHHPDFFTHDKDKEVLRSGTAVRVRVTEMSDSAIMLRAYYWAIDQPTSYSMQKDLLEKVKKRFDKEGVEIPYSYHTLVYKKDLPKTKRSSQKKSAKKRR